MSRSMEFGRNPSALDHEAPIEFALMYLQAIGARLEQPYPGIIRTELNRDQVCELENRPMGTWYTMQSVPELTTLYLGIQELDTDGGSQPESLEHIGLHAHRLRQMLTSAWRIGQVSRLRVTPQSAAVRDIYRPFALFGFEVGRCCSQRVTSPYTVAVDLVDGSASHSVAEALLNLPMDEQRVSRAERRRREIRYQYAFDIACESIKEALLADPVLWQWYHRAVDRLHAELDQVNQYFSFRKSEGPNKGENLEQQQKQAVTEVYRRFQPRIQLRARLGLLVYCPEAQLKSITGTSLSSADRLH